MAEQVTALTQQLPGDVARPSTPGDGAGDGTRTEGEDVASAAASQNSQDENNGGQRMEATEAKIDDHLESEFPLEGIDPKNARQTVSLMEVETLCELRNAADTTGVTSEETRGPSVPAEEDHASEMKVPEPTVEENQVDGPKPEDATTEAGHTQADAPLSVKQPEVTPDSVLSPASTKSEAESDGDNMGQAGDERNEREEQIKPVETIGVSCQEATDQTFPEDTGVFTGGKRLLLAVTVVGVLAVLVQFLLQPKSPPPLDDLRQIDIFLRQLEKVKTQFPNQRSELWSRSRIHLKRHLQTAQPTEPVSLILTAGLQAERTLRCLAQGLASAFSSALNASVLQINGTSKAGQDSDKVKLDIDKSLQEAFEGDKPVAVIHRFEELPPGSTLIFYRYCDHENAAFKKTFLIFTVLLGEEEVIPGQMRLSDVEEMVDDHLQKKFLSHGRPVSFDRMDLDKYGGLWSRISHLILPVASEERVERDGCEDT